MLAEVTAGHQMLTTVSTTHCTGGTGHTEGQVTASSTTFAVHQHVPISKMMQADVKTVRYPTKQLENIIGLRQIRHSFPLEISLLPLEDSTLQG